MVKKLQFTFSSESFENPVLQQHWRNIEALALDRDAPEEITDYTGQGDICASKHILTNPKVFELPSTLLKWHLEVAKGVH